VVDAGSSPLVTMVLGKNDRLRLKPSPLNCSEVIFADSHGRVTSYSLATWTSTGDFVGPTGSVLSLDVHKATGENDVLACVGLDRFLRIYDITTRKIIGNVYCKTKMTSVLIVDGSFPSPKQTIPSAKRRKIAESSHRDDDNESDSVWAKLPELETIGGSNIKRRRIRVPDPCPHVL